LIHSGPLDKKRILLVNAERTATRSPNLGLGYLAAVMRQAGWEVSVFDAAQHHQGTLELIAALKAGPWDLIGFQAYSSGYPITRAAARVAARLNPGTPIILGGRHASPLAEEALGEEPAFTWAVVSEGELSLQELAGHMDRGPLTDEILATVPNLVRRDGDKFSRGPSRNPENLDDLPLPAWDLIGPEHYPDNPIGAFVDALPVVPIITSRGCPCRCGFCGAHLAGTKIRLRSPEAVVDEMEYLHRRHNVREIQILDDNFNWHRSHAEGVCEQILKRDLKIFISFPNGLRLDHLDADLVRMFERAGCRSATIGIESGSQKTLDRMNRRITKEKMEHLLHEIKANSKIRLTGNFIIGVPGETADDIEQTIAYAASLPIDRASFMVYLPLPGTDFFDQLKAAGKLSSMDYGHLSPNEGVVPFVPDGMTTGDIRRFLFRCYATFYGRPSILKGLIHEVHSPGQLAFLLGKTVGRLSGPHLGGPSVKAFEAFERTI
jgi:radical SAM superfamily enzyme YgiQ (UPF0313 family)